MYFVKGLHHVEIYINTAINRYPNIEVRQIPHFMLSNIRRSGVFCFPQPETRIQKNSDIETEIRKETGEKYIFSGMKGEDGFLKRMRLKGFEDFTDHKGNVYPLALWTNKEVLRYISDNNLQTPIVYSVEYRPRVNKIGRLNPAKSGGIAFDLDVFLWLRDNYPCDLQMIYDEFPLSKQILWRYDKGIDK
jgi:sulfate adenylyltransferase subunit 2